MMGLDQSIRIVRTSLTYVYIKKILDSQQNGISMQHPMVPAMV